MGSASGGVEEIRKQNEELRASHDRPKWMARTDMLTQLSNRRDFLEKLHREIAASTRRGRSFVLALTDVDDLKTINDRHGHDTGDSVLVAMAGLLQNSLRVEDYVGRWGAAELILLFADADLDAGQASAEKIRRSVAERDPFIDEPPIAVTVMIGGCLFDGDADMNALLRRADAALHRGKAAGRDTVVLDGPAG